MRLVVMIFSFALMLSGVSTGFAEVLPDLSSLIKQYQAANQAKYAQMPTKAKQVMADTKRDLADKMHNPGLKIGSKVPDFTLPNALGKPVNLYEQLQKGPVILTFYRGAWCPFCSLQLKTYQEVMPTFKQYGASLVAVTPQKPDQSLKQLEKQALNFEVLSDLDSAVMKAYELRFVVPTKLVEVYKNMGLDLAEYNGEGRYELPVPGTFVLDQQGVIQAKFADTDYTKRMEPRDIVAALEKIKKE